MMKNYYLILISVFVFGSCSKVYFINPQPQKGMVLKSFIDDVQGEYADSLLKLKVDAHEIIIFSDTFRLSKEEPLENEVLVKFYNNFYFVNFKDSTYYTVFVGKFYEDKLAVYMLNPDQRSLNVLGRYVKVDTLNAETKTFLVNPSKKEFEALFENGVFEVSNVLSKQQ